jgi:secreted trypsin-like serine protease
VLVTAAGSAGTTICSGSIIAPARVLTAAHCALDAGKRRAPGAFMLLGGIVDSELGADWTRMQARSVAAVTVHPYYAAGQRGYDVAVLELAQPFDVSGAAVRPARCASTGGATRARTASTAGCARSPRPPCVPPSA